MKKYSLISFSLIFFLVFIPAFTFAQITDKYERQIDSIIAKMTLEEKIGQMTMRGTSSRVRGPLPKALKDAVRRGEVGTMLNVMNTDYLNELQHIAVEESELGIPLIFSRDVIHGFKTIFPIPLGMAATWDEKTVRIGSRIAAEEASSVGIRWTFAPMLDICRDSRWGRIAESPGEDPYLASVLAKAYIAGFQGENLSDPSSMAACAKHYIAYGAAEGGRDYNTTIISDPLLQNVYLPPFQAALDAGAATVMSSFNEVNGEPASGSEYLLKDILREQLGFQGFVISDWNSITEMIPHGYARDEKHAAERAANAGMDMEMMSKAYEHHLKTLVEEGKVKEEDLDFYVRNILRVKFSLNLFDKPYLEKSEKSVLYAEQYLEAAKIAAEQSMVLLKNEDRLPLNPTQKILMTGPMAHAPHEQLGTWTFDGESDHTQTPKMVFEAKGFSLDYVPALDFSRDTSTAAFEKAIKAAEAADVILFIGGEEAILSGEAHSRAHINLPGAQEELLKALAKTGKPIVLVIMAGRPITLEDILDKVDAVVMAWHPGTMGGPALHDVLYGLREPGGRLPVSWPKTAGQLPFYYNHKTTGRPANDRNFVHMDDIPVKAWQSSLGNHSHYLDAGFEPEFPFGYGLTYTKFDYHGMQISDAKMSRNGSIQIEISVKNKGKRAGTELVQLYVQDVTGSITRPVKELKGFQHVSLKPGQSKGLLFELKAEDLAFFNRKGEKVMEPGLFRVWVGPNSLEGIEGEFELVEEKSE
jgi:beta-glucosidase